MYNLSTFITTQQLTSVAKPYRENISELVTFYNANKSDMKAIIDDYLYGVAKDYINEIIIKLKNKYMKLEIDSRHPYGYKVEIPQNK